MTAMEVRNYCTVSKKLAEVEARSKLLEELKKNRVCLAEEEYFVQQETNKLKILGNFKGVVNKHQEELVLMSQNQGQ